ncbi:hypothetical protein FRX31_007703 [Thalictrum thalictroides]|uniref:Uncharacterized protein n=1 Tax=Thalictrum thalictroides TaxID=46969 RepID=A0A7J6WZ27_THATH|nr:hypothetical protein FRX31_007703 [Thalictrum thalictroides]
MEVTNHAANMRHLWHIFRNRDTMWVKWVKSYLIKDRNFWQLKIPKDCSWSWRSILKERDKAMYMVQHLIGNGQNTNFWLDPWLAILS